MSTLGGYRGSWGGYVTTAVVNGAVFSLDLKMAKLAADNHVLAREGSRFF